MQTSSELRVREPISLECAERDSRYYQGEIYYGSCFNDWNKDRFGNISELYRLRGSLKDVNDPSLENEEISWRLVRVYSATRPGAIFVVEMTNHEGRQLIRAVAHYKMAEFEGIFGSKHQLMNCVDITDAISS